MMIFLRWLIYYLAYPFRWRQRRKINALKLEVQQAAQGIFNAALDSFAKALAFIESLPDPPPPRRVRYRSNGYRPRSQSQ